MNKVFHWLIYYIKCGVNILYSYINNYNFIEQVEPNQEINNQKQRMEKIDKYLYKVHVEGSYYEMGKQYGKAMRRVLEKDVKIFIQFLKNNNDLYQRKIIEKYKKQTIFGSLLSYYEDNKKYFNPDIIEFTKGVSEGSAIEYNKLLYANLFPDITDNHCILVSKIIENKRMNLRTFDLGCPQVTHSLIVFNPKISGTNSTNNTKIHPNKYISLNASIVFGVVTGISEKNIFFGETYYDETLGELNYNGMPFHHISHEILKSCNNLEDADTILEKCNRTSNLQLMLSQKQNARIYFSCVDNLILDQNKENVESVTPNEQGNFKKNLHYLNSIENVIKEFIPRTKSGELHIMVSYDNKIYVSVTSDILQSYNNTFYEFSLDELFENHQKHKT